MTALREYARLETTGLWRQGADAEAREVGVALGKATLVLIDGAGVALAHWSLPAISRLNPGARPALFAPDEAGTETVEVDDETMVTAIEKVCRSVARRRRGTGRMRRGTLGMVAGLMALAAVLWLPGALRREALSVVPPSRRSEVGATLLGHIQRVEGAACRDALGTDAMERLRARVLGDAVGGQVVVLPDGPDAPLMLPGGIVVLSRTMVEDASEPAIVAGHILAAHVAHGGREPLGDVLDALGSFGVARLLVTGEIGAEALADHARDLLETTRPAVSLDDLRPAFAAADVGLVPYARAMGLDGADALTATGAPHLIGDGDWVSLQGICRG